MKQIKQVNFTMNNVLFLKEDLKNFSTKGFHVTDLDNKNFS